MIFRRSSLMSIGSSASPTSPVQSSISETVSAARLHRAILALEKATDQKALQKMERGIFPNPAATPPGTNFLHQVKAGCANTIGASRPHNVIRPKIPQREQTIPNINAAAVAAAKMSVCD
jgi:hypothetical protein